MKILIQVLSVGLAIGAASQAVADFNSSEDMVTNSASTFGTRERLYEFVSLEISSLEKNSEFLTFRDQQNLRVLKKIKTWLEAKSDSPPGP